MFVCVGKLTSFFLLLTCPDHSLATFVNRLIRLIRSICVVNVVKQIIDALTSIKMSMVLP